MMLFQRGLTYLCYPGLFKMLSPGQYIKLIFRNSMHIEGYVDSVTEASLTLISEDKKSKMIIPNLSSDVMAIKVFLEKKIPNTPESHTDKLGETNNELNALKKSIPQNNKENLKKIDMIKCEQPAASNEKKDLLTKDLASLRKMIIDEEKQYIKDTIKAHTISQPVGSYYGIPFVKKPGAK